MLSAIRTRWGAPQGYRDVLHVGLPLVASMISSTVMQFTDRLFLSHYSSVSIAAALPSAMVALVLQLPFVGLCSYVSVFIAHNVGAGRHHEVGASLWQGIWMALGATVFLLLSCLLAKPVFNLSGHPPAIMAEEIIYFQVLMLGSTFFLLSSVISAFFIGRGHTRPVLFANLAGAILNVPLDYALIFGKWGMPELGIAGAAGATITGWLFTAVTLGIGVFRKRNDKQFRVFRGWRFERSRFVRLLLFGVPSGVNLFMEVIGFTWFVLEVGKLGEVALAASNIALSLNSLIFIPMLGLNTAIASLVGQAMGRGKPAEAETATISALHISFIYMLPLCLLFALFAGPLVDIFRPEDAGAAYAPIRATGIVLIYYISLYSLVDSYNIIYLGALKGAGDTLFVMLILGGTGICGLILPIAILKSLDMAHLHSLWTVLTVYCIVMAFFARLRFRQRKWQKIRLIEH